MEYNVQSMPSDKSFFLYKHFCLHNAEPGPFTSLVQVQYWTLTVVDSLVFHLGLSPLMERDMSCKAPEAAGSRGGISS